MLCFVLNPQEHAFESSQKYKEGKFIIELAHMIKDNGWEWIWDLFFLRTAWVWLYVQDFTERSSGQRHMRSGGSAQNFKKPHNWFFCWLTWALVVSSSSSSFFPVTAFGVFYSVTSEPLFKENNCHMTIFFPRKKTQTIPCGFSAWMSTFLVRDSYWWQADVTG